MTLIGWVTGVGHLLGVARVFPRLSALIAGHHYSSCKRCISSGRIEPPLVITFIISVVPLRERAKRIIRPRLLLVLSGAIFERGPLKLCNGRAVPLDGPRVLL